MFKKWAVLFALALLTMSGKVFAENQSQDAEEQIKALHGIQDEMRTKHGIITPDAIYITTELKVISAQNNQMIELLKEIRFAQQREIDRER